MSTQPRPGNLDAMLSAALHHLADEHQRLVTALHQAGLLTDTDLLTHIAHQDRIAAALAELDQRRLPAPGGAHEQAARPEHAPAPPPPRPYPGRNPPATAGTTSPPRPRHR